MSQDDVVSSQSPSSPFPYPPPSFDTALRSGDTEAEGDSKPAMNTILWGNIHSSPPSSLSPMTLGHYHQDLPTYPSNANFGDSDQYADVRIQETGLDWNVEPRRRSGVFDYYMSSFHADDPFRARYPLFYAPLDDPVPAYDPSTSPLDCDRPAITPFESFSAAYVMPAAL
jgi:hypothetical protein